MKIYIAGPMSGLPEMNYPAFFAEATRLRGLGYEVINPDSGELFTFRDVLCALYFNIGGLILEMDRVTLLDCTHVPGDVRAEMERQ